KWYRVAWQIYAEYLEQKGLYDFADMLSLATKLIRESPKGTYHYQYILVDEVQDLSKSKCLMLQALLGNCKRVKLFAVGDDWQSIYRFAGSNLGILKDFEKTFGRTTYHSLIEHTYRFGQPTAMISGKFIKKNRAQSRKKVKIIKGKKTPIKIVLNHQQHSKAPPDYGVVDRYIKKLYVEYGEDFFTKRLQVISRYNRDIYRLVKTETGRYMNAKIVENTEEGIILDWWVPAANRCVQVAYCSMHKSKGITRDIVFVINMNEGDKGMPATRVDDPIMAMMLARPDHYPLAEERRLFYVAITRAKELTIIVSDYRKYSRFVREIAKYLPGETAEEILQTKRPKYK
ncbi:UvrD-helicase domain-containing protein, partial [Candidatus Saccharibacteria bacterium]|nr:UvrD-helicase domain-containing protein [Candidatus Saccharibacteria bacterium]